MFTNTSMSNEESKIADETSQDIELLIYKSINGGYKTPDVDICSQVESILSESFMSFPEKLASLLKIQKMGESQNYQNLT